MSEIEPKWTPGPWRLSLPDDTSIIADGRDVAVTVGNYCDDADAAVMEANARLIAAAPDLYAALELAKRMVDEALPKFDWGRSALDVNAIRLLNEAPIAINRALAKAVSA